MDVEKTKNIAEFIEVATRGLDSADTSSLDQHDKNTFLRIRTNFSSYLLSTDKYCDKYAIIFRFLRDSYNDKSIKREDLVNWLLKRNFHLVVRDADELYNQGRTLAFEIKDFIDLLNRKYSRSYFFNWKFFTLVLFCLSGIGMIIVGCVVPGMQLCIASGALTTVAGVSRLALRYQNFKKNGSIDERLRGLYGELQNTQQQLQVFDENVEVHRDSVHEIEILLELTRENEEQYLIDACNSFDSLKKAINFYLYGPPKDKSPLCNLSTAALAAGAVTVSASVLNASRPISNNDVIDLVEHSSSILSCTIM